MKQLLIIFGAMVCLLACQQRNSKTAGEQPAAPVTDSTSLTTIEWLDSTYKNLGTVKEGPEVDIAFRFKNTGDKDLVVENVTAGCGCTIVEKPQEPFAPGQTGAIKAKFTTKGHPNTNEKSIYVTTNSKLNPDQELKFRIVVEPVNNNQN